MVMIGRISIAVVAAAGLVGGGVGIADATSSHAVKACVNSSGFLVSATKHSCPRGSHAAAVGATGPRGANGAKGAKGDTGATGPSTLYTKQITAFDDSSKLTLPAGSYAVNWSLEADGSVSTTAGGGEVLQISDLCVLHGDLGTGLTGIDQATMTQSVSPYFHNTTTGKYFYQASGMVSGTTTVTGTGPITLALGCTGQTEDPTEAAVSGATYGEQDAVINAIAVGNVVSQS
jgi:hypothetical protein